MTHYQNAEIGVSFDLPDDPTTLQIITYDSTRLERQGEPAIIILWECVKPLISGWECDHLALADDLGKLRSRKAAQAAEYAAFRGSEWRVGLEEVSKNS
jgi:hypothetical protein